jgi:DNA topoisomerase-1
MAPRRPAVGHAMSPTPKKTPAETRRPRTRAPSRAKASARKAPAGGAAAEESSAETPRGRGKSLVVVESPAKARTINKYLGSRYVVRASMGHVRDLPKGRLGIDLEHGFEPDYTTIRGKAKVVSELRRLAHSADAVYLAPDQDREGEAIAWHLSELLDEADRAKVQRVTFNEITKNAILKAFEHPGTLDMAKVDAQQARRVLDRIMGYKLSPLLWKKVAKGLSAGRVQSVAVRLIVEREREIRAFVKEEYWRVTAQFDEGGKPFHAELRRLGEKRIDKNLDERAARAVVERIGGDPLELAELEEKPKTRPTTPPFTTSQLQQKASTMLRFSAKKTMTLAQRLYEGKDVPGEGSVGLITYMRTDSMRVSEDALASARRLIGERYGREYVPDKPNYFRSRAGAQEAHEAIRPTDVERTPDKLRGALGDDELKLYTLIWNKFVASQMAPERSNVTTAVFVHGQARFVAQGEVLVFDGHARVFNPGKGEREDQELPTSLRRGERYRPTKIDATQHFTQPPPRYSEATLVKELEKKGIGRPSTYAAIISTIQERGYVTLESRRFKATELGEVVTDQLVLHFADMINTEFTARMEGDLDRIASGEEAWRSVVQTFHEIFSRDLERAELEMKNLKREPTLSDRLCEKCGAPMAVLFNKRGKFLGCSRYPECKNTMPMEGPRESAEAIPTDKLCEKCGKPMVIRTGKRGRFIACTGFPRCKNTASVDEAGNVIEPAQTGIACDKCGSPMVVKGSRRGPFLACSAFPRCRNAKPLPEGLREKPEPTGETCEKCGAPMVRKTSRWGKPFLGCSAYPSCKNTREPAAVSPPDASQEGAAVPASGSEADGDGSQP